MLKFGFLCVVIGMIGLLFSPSFSISNTAHRLVGALISDTTNTANTDSKPATHFRSWDMLSLLMIAIGLAFLVTGMLTRY